MRSPWRIVLAIGLAVACVAPLVAHELPLEVQAYFKVEGTTLRVVARVPLATLADAQFPLAPGGTLDLPGSAQKLGAAAADFVRNADVVDYRDAGDDGTGVPLGAPTLTWRVSMQNDPAFAAYESAIGQMAALPLLPQAPVDVNRGFLDVRLDYALRSPAPRLSVRFNALRINGVFVPTRATYITNTGETRSFIVAGPPHRVPFEPSWSDAASMFARFGTSRIAFERGLLLFLFCLAIPVRSLRETARLVATTLAVYAAAVALSTGLPVLADARITGAAAFVAALALGVAAVQNLVQPRTAWVSAVSIVFGLASGVVTARAVADILAFGGSHGLTSLVLFVGMVVAGVALLGTCVVYAVGRFRQLPIPAALAGILLSMVPLHLALHDLALQGQSVSDAVANTGGGIWTAALAHWPPLAAVVGLAVLAGLRSAASVQRPAGR